MTHRITLLQSGADFFAALLQCIDAAQDEVRLETYIFNEDASGSAVADALVRAARRGIRVYFLVDGVGTPVVTAVRRAAFLQAGVSLETFSPLGRLGLLVPSRWRRLHRKLCVIDRGTLFCGGINLLDDHVDPNHGPLTAPRLDFAVQVQGPLVAQASQAMELLWWRVKAADSLRQRQFKSALQDLGRVKSVRMQGRLPLQSTGTAPERPPPSVEAELVLRDNFRNRTRIERAYRLAIGRARTDIVIANAYFLPGLKLRMGLIHAARRGVRVRLLLQGRYEYFMQYHAARPVYHALLAEGIEIHEYSRSFLHAKVAVIDGHWATVGSSNLDPLSLLLAREANVVVNDAGFARDLQARLEEVMQLEGSRVDPVVFANRPWTQRVLDRVAFGVMRVLLFLSGSRY